MSEQLPLWVAIVGALGIGSILATGITLWFTARQQRKNWIKDNKKLEWRELIDALREAIRVMASNYEHGMPLNVVAGCKTLATRDGKPLQVLSRNASSDLALLQADFVPSSVAVFRTGPAPKLGDSVVAFGFPLPGLLSSEGNVSAGILSATSGLQNDVRFIQISAPVQPGNSGGPLFDSSGHVIGVVVAKLDAVRVAQITGDVPQNVNFAVNWAEVRAFLDDAGVPYQKEISQRSSTTSSTAAAASRIAVAIECTP